MPVVEHRKSAGHTDSCRDHRILARVRGGIEYGQRAIRLQHKDALAVRARYQPERTRAERDRARIPWRPVNRIEVAYRAVALVRDVELVLVRRDGDRNRTVSDPKWGNERGVRIHHSDRIVVGKAWVGYEFRQRHVSERIRRR